MAVALGGKPRYRGYLSGGLRGGNRSSKQVPLSHRHDLVDHRALQASQAWFARPLRLTARKYASGLCTLIVAPDLKAGGLPLAKRKRAQRAEKAASNLVILHETQRKLKIGNRWRKKPLATSYTRSARHMLRDAVAVIDRVKVGRGFFVTLTIPTESEAAFESLSIASGYMINRLTRRLRDWAVEGMYAYCWELQDRGTPHLHIVYRLADTADVPEHYNEVRRWWTKLLREVSTDVGINCMSRDGDWEDSTSNEYARCNFKTTKKGIDNYLSKYLSKVRTKGGAESGWCPGRWTGVSYPAREAVRQARDAISFVSTDRQVVFELFEKLSKSGQRVAGKRRILLSTLPGDVLIGSLPMKFAQANRWAFVAKKLVGNHERAPGQTMP